MSRFYTTLEKYNALNIKEFYDEIKKKNKYKIMNIGTENLLELIEINNIKIKEGKIKQHIVSKNYANAVTNFILTIKIKPKRPLEFYNKYNVEDISNALYNNLDNTFVILNSIITEELDLYTFRFYCVSIVKKIFLEDIIEEIVADGRTIEMYQGALSNNKIFGGKDKPMTRLNQLILKIFNDMGCNDIIAGYPDYLLKFNRKYFEDKINELMGIKQDCRNFKKLMKTTKEKNIEVYNKLLEIADENYILIEDLYKQDK
ncbi:MAG TPA: hypothetical protein VIK86_06625 [Candidatus Paceibacterota bacterium]